MDVVGLASGSRLVRAVSLCGAAACLIIGNLPQNSSDNRSLSAEVAPLESMRARLALNPIPAQRSAPSRPLVAHPRVASQTSFGGAQGTSPGAAPPVAYESFERRRSAGQQSRSSLGVPPLSGAGAGNARQRRDPMIIINQSGNLPGVVTSGRSLTPRQNAVLARTRATRVSAAGAAVVAATDANRSGRSSNAAAQSTPVPGATATPDVPPLYSFQRTGSDEVSVFEKRSLSTDPILIALQIADGTQPFVVFEEAGADAWRRIIEELFVALEDPSLIGQRGAAGLTLGRLTNTNVLNILDLKNGDVITAVDGTSFFLVSSEDLLTALSSDTVVLNVTRGSQLLEVSMLRP